MDDGVRRVDDGAVDEVVGQVEQAADERPVALHDLVAQALEVGRRPLDDEAALGPRRHDDRVLDHLRLHQSEDLGAEVLPPVAPAQPAAGDRAAAQVDALDPRPAHPDLVAWPRQRQLGDRRRIELERDGQPVAVVVRAHRRVDQRQEHPADAIVVEAGDGIEGGADTLADLGLRPVALVAVGPGRVEAGVEQGDEVGDHSRMGLQRRLDVGLAEREADLPQVLAVGADDGDLAGGQAGRQHEPVEAVALDVAEDERGEGPLQVGPPSAVQLDTSPARARRCRRGTPARRRSGTCGTARPTPRGPGGRAAATALTATPAHPGGRCGSATRASGASMS